MYDITKDIERLLDLDISDIKKGVPYKLVDYDEVKCKFVKNYVEVWLEIRGFCDDKLEKACYILASLLPEEYYTGRELNLYAAAWYAIGYSYSYGKFKPGDWMAAIGAHPLHTHHRHLWENNPRLGIKDVTVDKLNFYKMLPVVTSCDDLARDEVMYDEFLFEHETPEGVEHTIMSLALQCPYGLIKTFGIHNAVEAAYAVYDMITSKDITHRLVAVFMKEDTQWGRDTAALNRIIENLYKDVSVCIALSKFRAEEI